MSDPPLIKFIEPVTAKWTAGYSVVTIANLWLTQDSTLPTILHVWAWIAMALGSVMIVLIVGFNLYLAIQVRLAIRAMNQSTSEEAS